jgi:hypothetical protein
MTRTLGFALALAAALVTTSAQADEAVVAQGQVEHPHVRASHHVDVIAPGERVQTVLDRMRAAQPPGNGQRQPASARTSTGREDGSRGGADSAGGGQGPGEDQEHLEQGGASQPQPRADERSNEGTHHHYLARPKG